MNGHTEVPAVIYGFVGLGQMGWGMATNLRTKIPKSSGFIICELLESRRTQFMKETEGLIQAVNSPREVAEKADVIITMLPKGRHVRDAFLNPSTGLLSIPGRDSPILFIECSTIDVATSLEVRDSVIASELGSFVDAPVSGGPNGANHGTLTFMVGGTDAQFSQVSPIISLMGKKENIFRCGPAGAGLATKQINNYLSSVCTIGVCEAMNTGIKYGLDPKVLAKVINSSSGRCYNSLEQNPVKGVTPGAASEKDFEGGFSVELCKGVLEMAVGLVKQVGAQSVFADPVLQVYEKAISDERCKGKDSRSVFRLFVDGAA